VNLHDHDRALKPRARYFAEQLRPHLTTNLPGQPKTGRSMAMLMDLSGLAAHQVTLAIASIRAQFPEVPLLTYRSVEDGRTPLYAFDANPEAVQKWGRERLQIMYTIASRTWSGAMYQMVQALPEGQRALATLQFKQFLETVEAVAG
jgi:hypothetical protein